MGRFLIFCILFLSVQKQLSDNYVNARVAIAADQFKDSEKNPDILQLFECIDCRNYKSAACYNMNSTECENIICGPVIKDCRQCFKDLCYEYNEEKNQEKNDKSDMPSYFLTMNDNGFAIMILSLFFILFIVMAIILDGFTDIREARRILAARGVPYV